MGFKKKLVQNHLQCVTWSIRVLDSQKMVLYVEGPADLLFYSEKKYCTLKSAIIILSGLSGLFTTAQTCPQKSWETLLNIALIKGWAQLVKVWSGSHWDVLKHLAAWGVHSRCWICYKWTIYKQNWQLGKQSRSSAAFQGHRCWMCPSTLVRSGPAWKVGSWVQQEYTARYFNRTVQISF